MGGVGGGVGVVVRLVHGRLFRAGSLMGGMSMDSMPVAGGCLVFASTAAVRAWCLSSPAVLGGGGCGVGVVVRTRGGWLLVGCQARCWVLRDRTTTS